MSYNTSQNSIQYQSSIVYPRLWAVSVSLLLRSRWFGVRDSAMNPKCDVPFHSELIKKNKRRRMQQRNLPLQNLPRLQRERQARHQKLVAEESSLVVLVARDNWPVRLQRIYYGHIIKYNEIIISKLRHIYSNFLFGTDYIDDIVENIIAHLTLLAASAIRHQSSKHHQLPLTYITGAWHFISQHNDK